MQNTITIISVILNIILVLLVFFKTALNEILKEWWQDKRNSQKELKERLITLRSTLLELSNTSTLLLILTAAKKNEKDIEVQKMYKEKWDNALSTYGELTDFITKNLPYYPIKVRKQYEEFESEMQKATGEVLTALMYKEKLLEITENLTLIITNTIEDVDTHLS
ncbi:hypothetical protein [Desulfobacula sp.]|uniref:hypothetical protein n=1 Tax=Desulfobacula sp. TaxID=2593537 RepID=UPI0025C16ABD|nr:hypothetical protein [Desulfobacula sp.]MBC2703098.1 hypothetical protein [Desulfobacula sp.]